MCKKLSHLPDIKIFVGTNPIDIIKAAASAFVQYVKGPLLNKDFSFKDFKPASPVGTTNLIPAKAGYSNKLTLDACLGSVFLNPRAIWVKNIERIGRITNNTSKVYTFLVL